MRIPQKLLPRLNLTIGTDQWKDVEEYIQVLLDALNTELQSAEGVPLYRAQGKAKLLRELLELPKTVRQDYEALRNGE